jgi:hypothetical protein
MPGSISSSHTKSYHARLYNRDSGDSQAAICTIDAGDSLTIGYTDDKFPPYTASLNDFDISLGGSDDDKIILNHVQSGNRLVISELSFIDELGDRSEQLARRLRSTKQKKDLARVASTLMAYSLPICVFGFLGFIVIIALLVSIAKSNSPSDTQSTNTAANTEVTENEQALLTKYGEFVSTELGKTWKPPKVKKKTHSVLQVNIGPEAKLTDIELLKDFPSHNKAFDNSILKCAKSQPKLKYCPPNKANIVMTIDFTEEGGSKSVVALETDELAEQQQSDEQDQTDAQTEEQSEQQQ